MKSVENVKQNPDKERKFLALHDTQQYFILNEDCEPIAAIPIANMNKPVFFSSDNIVRISLAGESHIDFLKESQSSRPRADFQFWEEADGKQLACLFNKFKTSKALTQLMKMLGGSVKIEWGGPGKQTSVETQHTLTIYSDCLYDDECEDNTGFVFLSSYVEAPFSWADAVALGNKVRDFCERLVAAGQE